MSETTVIRGDEIPGSVPRLSCEWCTIFKSEGG